MAILNFLNRSLVLPLLGLLWLYQHTFSLDHGPLKHFYRYGYCRFYPTCSMYAKAVLETEGLIGAPKILWRVLRCNPFSQPRIDQPNV